MRSHANLASITPPSPASSNSFQNLETLTSKNTSLVIDHPCKLQEHDAHHGALLLAHTEAANVTELTKQAFPHVSCITVPGHYTSMDLSHMSIDPNPGFPQSMWPSRRCGQLNMLVGLLRTGNGSFSQLSWNSCSSSWMGASTAAGWSLGRP